MSCAFDTWTITCIQCGCTLNDDGDTHWVHAEPAVNYPGDPVCDDCYGAGPSAAFTPDRKDEL